MRAPHASWAPEADHIVQAVGELLDAPGAYQAMTATPTPTATATPRSASSRAPAPSWRGCRGDLVVSTYPSGDNLKEGMVQRVAHIDSLMASVPRNYLDISFRRFLRREVRSDGLATVYCLNFFVHFFLILRLLRAARTVYVHSAYNALRMMVFPTRARIIFDAHGVVPEECAQEGPGRLRRACCPWRRASCCAAATRWCASRRPCWPTSGKSMAGARTAWS
jgi:hypothetical protein